MTTTRKLGTIAGALLISASLFAGSAFAAEKMEKPDLKQRLEEKVREGKLTAGEAEVVQQLHDLRRSYHEKFRTDAQSLIDKAVKDGKITKEQADRFKAPRKQRKPVDGPVMQPAPEQTNDQEQDHDR
ncbi:MAG: hypothetical protein K0R39_4632 [Symbiobacteriaceae bacterium]|jgi:polyhydroxyalkanoate synthesis regulator phasin|nr:hypothetical protein [Symbiobacteriaceae bacterium]